MYLAAKVSRQYCFSSKKKDKSVSYKTRHTHAFAFELIAQYIAGVADTQRPINLLLYNQLIYYISLEAGRRFTDRNEKKKIFVDKIKLYHRHRCCCLAVSYVWNRDRIIILSYIYRFGLKLSKIRSSIILCLPYFFFHIWEVSFMLNGHDYSYLATLLSFWVIQLMILKQIYLGSKPD